MDGSPPPAASRVGAANVASDAVRAPRAPASLSFVLPAFNEAENIGEAVRRCALVADELGLEHEIIVVDDGSRDDTRGRVEALVAENSRVRAVHHPTNRGYGAALRSGILAARMDRVFFTDADLQFDVRELGGLLAYADRYHIVAGYRAPRRDPIGRRLLGWTWSTLVGALFDLDVRDVDCAFKLIDRRIFDEIDISSLGALVNTELLVRARARGFTLVQVPVRHFPRRAGVQSGASLRVISKAARELASFYLELRAVSQQDAAPRRVGGVGR